jgi:hypothetical protein
LADGGDAALVELRSFPLKALLRDLQIELALQSELRLVVSYLDNDDEGDV